MIEVHIDGKKVEVPEGSMVMHAAEKAGTYIPHFCYHKKLSIAASCRMCLVDVEKSPKPVPACATPVTHGMVVHTRTEKAVNAQKSVMEFLLINHPLDCPVCDQGGECQLQDLAVGYGASASRYEEEKRSVRAKNVGPLISMEEMSRCIQCTRCVRFGQEIAGDMEFGMVNRGERSAIETFLSENISSELSGNMIDICPVGALTSKPFRFSARTWELSRRKSISPHDSTGANLVIQVKNNRVMRVVPFENEDVNECWIADRDRFSYEALNGSERLLNPMLKEGGEWIDVSWEKALDFVAKKISNIVEAEGPSALGALVSPHSTTEEIYLTARLIRGLGSENIDYRLRHFNFETYEGVHWLGMPISLLSELDCAFVVGSNLRKDHPLFAQRFRQAIKRGAKISSLTAKEMLLSDDAWAMPLHAAITCEPEEWWQVLADVAQSVALLKNIECPFSGNSTPEAMAIAKTLVDTLSEDKAIFMGNLAVHHPDSPALFSVAQWIAEKSNVKLGFLTEAANTVGAQLAGGLPGQHGINVKEILAGKVSGLLLLGCEPGWDTAGRYLHRHDGGIVVTLNAFKTNLECSDVLLPIAPFTETSGTFINAEGRMQSFHAAVKPAGNARPGWKVLRILAEMMELRGFGYNSTAEIISEIFPNGEYIQSRLNNRVDIKYSPSLGWEKLKAVGIYQLDGIVRRAPSLQSTADGMRNVLI